MILEGNSQGIRTFVTKVSFLLSEIHMSFFLMISEKTINLVNRVQLILLACYHFIRMADLQRNDQSNIKIFTLTLILALVEQKTM